MTEHESAVLNDLCGDVRNLTAVVGTLSSDMRDHMTRDGHAWGEMHSLQTEVFGVDGDPSKLGLKGRVLRTEDRLNDHDNKFDEIRQSYRGGLSAVWHLVTAGIAAVVGVLAKVWFDTRHP